MYTKKRDYDVPDYKWQLVEWLHHWYKEPGDVCNSKYNRMTKAALYAKYFEIRDEIIKKRSITGEGVTRS